MRTIPNIDKQLLKPDYFTDTIFSTWWLLQKENLTWLDEDVVISSLLIQC